MNTSHNNSSGKLSYISPAIDCILLDNEISLQLESPGVPDSGDEVNNAPNYIKSNPFKTQTA